MDYHKLQKVRSNHENVDKYNDNNCAICFEKYSKNIWILSCYHKFDISCLIQWDKKSCSICSRRIDPEEFEAIKYPHINACLFNNIRHIGITTIISKPLAVALSFEKHVINNAEDGCSGYGKWDDNNCTSCRSHLDRIHMSSRLLARRLKIIRENKKRTMPWYQIMNEDDELRWNGNIGGQLINNCNYDGITLAGLEEYTFDDEKISSVEMKESLKPKAMMTHINTNIGMSIKKRFTQHIGRSMRISSHEELPYSQPVLIYDKKQMEELTKKLKEKSGLNNLFIVASSPNYLQVNNGMIMEPGPL